MWILRARWLFFNIKSFSLFFGCCLKSKMAFVGLERSEQCVCVSIYIYIYIYIAFLT